MSTQTGTPFPVHDIQSAPEGSRPLLEGAQKRLGFVPNLFGVFASSPAVLAAYGELSTRFDQTSFTPSERQLVLLETSRVNACGYCMAAHGTIATMQKVPAELVSAIREDRPLGDPRLEALRTFTRSVVQERGRVGEEALAAFLASGWSSAQALEVLLGVTLKTLSNYVNHLAETPLDEAFQPFAWTPPA